MSARRNSCVKQPLAIVGASTRSAAASAVRSGFQPLAADLFADADLRRIATSTRISPYPDGFLDWLRTTEPPGWMYTGALENYPELVDQMAWIAPLLGNPGDVLTRVRSPWELSNTLRSVGLLFPETVASADGLRNDGTWLAKTYQGASGSGVRSIEPGTGGGAPNDDGEGWARNAVYQRRVAGVPCAAVYVAMEGTASLLGVTRQIIGESWLGGHGFQYGGSIGPWPVSTTTRAALVRIGDVLAEQFELTGLFGVDFILAGDDVWTLEVNPRYTASVEIVERFTGTFAMGAHVTACNGAFASGQRAGPFAAPNADVDAAHSNFHGKAILFAKRDLAITQLFADLALEEALREPWPMIADVSPAGTLIDAGRPVLTMFAKGSMVEDVEQHLRERVVEIEAKLYSER